MAMHLRRLPVARQGTRSSKDDLTGAYIERADRLSLVMEGVYASAQARGDHGPARQARALAEALLDAPRPQPS